MTKLRTIGVAILLFFSTFTNAQDQISHTCPSEWQSIGISCYRIFGNVAETASTWENAYRTCQGHGSMLVEIDDYYTNDEIGEFAKNRQGPKFWIGMSTKNANSDGVSTTWNMQKPATVYQGFYGNNMPDLQRGDCMYVESGQGNPEYQWKVGNCKEKMAFVCQRPSCPAGSFFCNNGRCINNAWICDGEDNCGDFSDENSCSSKCRRELIQAAGTIQSPNWPQSYDASKVCTWTIIGKEGTNVFVNFTSFHTEANRDIVDILIGGRTETTSTSIARISGTSPQTTQFRSFNNYMIIRFQSDQELQYPGFTATFTSLSDNYGSEIRLTASNNPVSLEPPLFSSTAMNAYLGNKDYVWVILAEENRKIITIERVMLDLAEGDEIDIHDGDSPYAPIIARYRPNNNDAVPWTLHTREPPYGPRFVFSTGNRMYIIMRTGRSTRGNGFRFNYQQGCDVLYTEEYGEIFSPGYGAVNYANNQICTWTINIPSRKAVSVQFDPRFALQDNYDYLQIFKGATDSSGSAAHPDPKGFTTVSLATNNPVKSVDGKMYLRFQTGAVTNARGFRALYSVDCPSLQSSFTPQTIKRQAQPDSYRVQIEITCAPGYSFRTEEFQTQDVEMECMFGGKWLSANKTRTIPSCLPKYCGIPPTVQNGYVAASSGAVYNSYARYRCYQGYRLVGQANVTCQDSGFWTAPPSCQAASCPTVGDIVNGRRTVRSGDLTSYASIILYECDEGYELEGVPILFCQSNGSWSASVPTCRLLKCPLPTIMHGTLSQTTMPDVGQNVIVSCGTGYQVNGASTMTCLANQTFDAIPSCNDINECNPLASCAQRCQNTDGSYTCSCNDGYTLNSDGRICDDIDECSMDNGGCDQRCDNSPGTYTCSCTETGYTLFDTDGKSGYNIRVGVETGRRINDTLHLNHTCVLVSCPAPENVNHSSLMTQRTTHRYQDRIRYFCDLGYVKTSGSDEFTCGSDGQWSPSQSSDIPVCSRATCPPENPGGLSLKNPPRSVTPSTAVEYLEYVNISCSVPGRGTFMKQRQCLYNKETGSYELYGAQYECGVIDCGNPSQEPNTNYQLPSDTTFGSTFRFTCAALMTLNGNSSLGNDTVQCRADGKWDFGSLQCLGSSCPDPGYPVGGYQNATSYAKGSVVTFGCNRQGYGLTYTDGWECILNGAGTDLIWNSSVLPKCVDQQRPTVSNCESSKTVDPYTMAILTLPITSDNTGIKTQGFTPPNANTTLVVEKLPVTITYTAEDFEGLNQSCTTTISVRDNVPPTVTCPSSRIEYLQDDSKTIITVNPASISADDTTPAGAAGTPTVTVSPEQVTIGPTDIDSVFPVVVTATDSVGLQDVCQFQILVKADPCSPLSLPTPVNGSKNCSAVTGGYECDLKCNNNYVSYDSPTEDAKRVTCSSGGAWSSTHLQCVLMSERAEYQQIHRIVYSNTAGTALQAECIGTYEAALRAQIPSDEQGLNTRLKSEGCSVDILDAQVRGTFISSSQINFTIPIKIQNNSPYCTSIVKVEFEYNKLAIMTAATNNCTDITGTWDGNAFTDGNLCPSEKKLADVGGTEYCFSCPPGTYISGAAQCSPCPKGTYNGVEGAQQCTACPSGQSTYETRSTSASACKSQCAIGFISQDAETGLPPCTQCAKNSYWVNSTTCQSCNSGQITLRTGAGSGGLCLDECPSGNYSYNGHAPCLPCPRHYFQPNSGQTSCFRCQTTSTSVPGSAQCTPINATITCSGVCLNGATCSIRDNDFHCACAPGYLGRRCNGVVENCASNPCFNNGVCRSGVNSFTCTCPPGVTGTRCETDMVNECDTNPCKNGGMCSNRIGSFRCFCTAGYSGTTCQSQQDICVLEPCQNGATCVNLDNVRRRCDCPPGFNGTNCENDIDDCASDPCLYGGVCTDLVNSYRCDCPPGYGGPRCATRVNPCSLNLCSNGQCVDDYTVDNFRCVCNPGYAYGRVCHYEVSLSTGISSPSLFNLGTDVDRASCIASCDARNNCYYVTYNESSRLCQYSVYPDSPTTDEEIGTDLYSKRCISPDDDYFSPWYNVETGGSELRTSLGKYNVKVCNGTQPLAAECRKVNSSMMSDETGDVFSQNCNVDGIVCQSSAANPCEDYEVRYKCSVSKVFEGKNCAQKQYCTSSTCERGNCINTLGSFTCSCPQYYEGVLCQHNIDDCPSNNCQNGATCRDGDGQSFCDCLPGFGGTTCQINLNDCGNCSASTTTTCNDLVDDYECICQPGFTGKNCSEDIDECASNPCLHGGSCDNLRNGFRCNCVSGWTGDRCERIVESCQPNSCAFDSNCQNLFDNFYCSCANNTYGQQCENSPNICQDVRPCLNGAVCAGGRTEEVTCTCPNMNFRGDGCETMVDHCAVADKCKNGGTCMNNVPGFSCSCADGYTGATCETNINDCSNVTCPGTGSMCIDMINQQYCRCPLGKVGDTCNRDLNTDYDLYFYLPQRNGYASLPYPIKLMGGAWSVSMWIRFYQTSLSGTYFTMFTTPSANSLVGTEKFISLDDQGLTIYHPTAGERRIDHQYAVVNDGKWHYVVVTWSKDSGFELVADSIREGDIKDFTEYMGSDQNLNIWISLGAHYGNDMMIQDDMGFRGYLSQLNVYSRQLNFQSEIPQLFVSPQKVFTGVILQWNEFIYHRGVQPIYPSSASKDGCIGSCTQSDKVAPTYRGCPSDIYVYSADRLTTVTWPEPVADGAQTEKKRYNSGETFPWGKFTNTYEAKDAANNTVFCSFKIYVMSDNCSKPADPYEGSQTCERNYYPHIGCQIGCKNPSIQRIDRHTPKIYTCGPSGSWYPKERFRKVRYPSCGLIAGVARKRLAVRLVYPRVTSRNCDIINTTLDRKIRETLRLISSIWSSSSICQRQDCSDVLIQIVCNASTLAGRRKRQTTYTQLSADFTIPQADATWTNSSSSESLSADEAITRHVLEELLFDYPLVIPGAEMDPNQFVVTSTSTCPEPQVALEGYCVKCGAGNFFNNVTKTCEDCPIGEFQTMYNQTSCTPCAPGSTTEYTGTFDSADCKANCNPGNYLDVDRCKLCPVGYYQSMSGKFYCDPCPAGKTTRDPGSTNSTACYDDCPSGQELTPSGSCIPCAVGTYRTQGAHTVCQNCPSDRTTPSTGSRTSADCTLISCLAGNYRVGENPGTCMACPIGTYQDQKWQTSCKNCSSTNQDRYRTDQEGSTSPDQCKFFCQSGFEANGTRCDRCPIGFYKDNSESYYSPCKPCPGNKRTTTEGSTSAADCTIYRCAAGYKPNSTSDGCDPCPYGTYQSQPDQENCDSCPGGHSTRVMAATSSNQCVKFCEDGQEVDGFGTCKNCSRGFYKTNTDFKFNNCTMCPENYVTPGIKSTSQSDCTVRNCTAGTRRNTGDTDCIDCPRGTYQELPYQTQCTPCPGQQQSTRLVKSTSVTDCEDYCDPGKEKDANGVCVVCAVGFYKDNNIDVFSTCTPCPDSSFITPGNGSTSPSDCTVANCSAGYYRDGNTCVQCAKGTYQPDKWQTSCIPCPTDKTTAGPGATDSTECQLNCPPGKEDINGTCEPCPRGYYKSVSAAAKCDMCLVNFTTSGTGANDVAQCNVAGCHPGYYLNDTNNQCMMCPYDKYQPMKWQTSCIDCGQGKVTLYRGSTSVDKCVNECPSGNEYLPAGGCNPCDRGYYRDQGDRTTITCQLCPIDRITPLNDLGTSIASCSLANCTTPGYYRNTSTNQCTLCRAGTYNSVKWVESCSDCGIGFTTNGTGKTDQSDCIRDCPSGSFNHPSDLSRCVNCIQGTYRNKADGLFPCVNCPSGYTTPSEAATSRDNCSITACQKGEQFRNNACEPCPLNTYQDQDNQRDCLPCGFGKYTESTGSNSKTQCKTHCVDTNECHDSATCQATQSSFNCTCMSDWRGDGRNCTHVCYLGYCTRGNCLKSPLSCSCPDGYEGDRCESAVDRSAQSSRLNETIIIASVSAGAFLMIVIIIIVCCVAMARKSKKPKQKFPYSEMPAQEKTVFMPMGISPYDNHSMRSYPSQRGTVGRYGMSQMPELTYDNQAYQGRSRDPSPVAAYHYHPEGYHFQEDPAVYTA